MGGLGWGWGAWRRGGSALKGARMQARECLLGACSHGQPLMSSESQAEAAPGAPPAAVVGRMAETRKLVPQDSAVLPASTPDAAVEAVFQAPDSAWYSTVSEAAPLGTPAALAAAPAGTVMLRAGRRAWTGRQAGGSKPCGTSSLRLMLGTAR